MREVVKNTTDKQQLKSARRISRVRQLELKQSIQTIAALPGGQGLKFLWHVLGMAGTFGSPYSPPDTEFLAGRQDVGLQLLEEINRADPRIFVAMYNLNLDEEEENGESSGRAGANPADEHPGTGPVESGWDYDPIGSSEDLGPIG